ncbi:MAG: hypothetical protein CBC48_10035 [bacterium TMED88]|nr:hypothetical protein [Deltaproteobacteria bacterium]OUV30916.1 MAG: hypothetical protein CBC48_10035 [bacterium TMED88]
MNPSTPINDGLCGFTLAGADLRPGLRGKNDVFVVLFKLFLESFVNGQGDLQLRWPCGRKLLLIDRSYVSHHARDLFGHLIGQNVGFRRVSVKVEEPYTVLIFQPL